MFLKLQPSTHACLFLFIIFLFHSFAFSYQQVCSDQDKSSLLAFFTNISTSSSPPLNWSSNISCCRWEGIDCDTSGRVTRLELPSRGLEGVISSSLGNLVSLTHLNLSHNLLSGPLPDGLFGLMDSLEMVDLSSNDLSGNFSLSLSPYSSFPSKIHTIVVSNNKFEGIIESTWFSGDKKLTSFNCSNNSFYGPIPSSICVSSPVFKSLDFSNNHFSGPVPGGLQGCVQLEVLRAGSNKLSGTLPKSIYCLRELKEISIPGNDLQGPLANEIVNLTKLKIIDLFSNSFLGMIPHEIGRLSHLEKLQLGHNHFSGPIPSSLMNCTKLVHITLLDNLLIGDISKLDFSRLAQLQKLDLASNHFSGNLPQSIYTCKSLIAIRVSGNNLSGHISPKIVELKSLSFLALAGNSLTNIRSALSILSNCKNLTTLLLGISFPGESLPSDKDFIGSDGFPNLQHLIINGCNHSSIIPEWLSNLRRLETLGLQENKFTGGIPLWLGTLPSLFYLRLDRNSLSGEFPKELCQLPALVSEKETTFNHLDLELPAFSDLSSKTSGEFSAMRPGISLAYNNLRGGIPPEIGKLRNIHELRLQNNHFSGKIPTGISSLKNLELLDLSENNLIGEIPTSLGSTLNFLSQFNVSNNDLEGPIPTTGQFETFTESSFKGNPGLCGEVLHLPCSGPVEPEAKGQPTNKGRDKKHSFLDGLFVGFATGFSSVLAIVASYAWYKFCR